MASVDPTMLQRALFCSSATGRQAPIRSVPISFFADYTDTAYSRCALFLPIPITTDCSHIGTDYGSVACNILKKYFNDKLQNKFLKCISITFVNHFG